MATSSRSGAEEPLENEAVAAGEHGAFAGERHAALVIDAEAPDIAVVTGQKALAARPVQPVAAHLARAVHQRRADHAADALRNG